MLIVSDNLRALVASHAICAIGTVEEFSLQVALGPTVRWPRHGVDQPVVYGTPYEPNGYFSEEEEVGAGLLLRPGACALACSAQRYRMPSGYFGLLQTKGSLARLFVALTCNDGQIEPGFDGRITLELFNAGPIPVQLPAGAVVGQLYLFRCSTDAVRPYAGRYQHASGPTIASFDQDKMS